MTLEIIFFVSLLSAASILLSKYIILRTGRANFLGSIFGAFDNRSESLIHKIKYRIFQAIQIARFLILVRLPEKSRVSYQEAREAALREYKKKKEVLMGKKVIKENGAVSFFLRKIKEDVHHNGGRIEETL